ncbi:unnamed protein product [Eruca vesicaria subsp. sativa]|uniref:HVA22-like protein n=1 Tax=Eruca vesicaria subsp. sativa TaxID=29727 RepID=A0ABC8KE35_ERUVS|nr:unnamed protein product [Eruca vesicaria subsp. sativa]
MSLVPKYGMHDTVGANFIVREGWRLPLYGEMKVVFFVYLWYPKTKVINTTCIETLLKPYIAQHETEIDRKIMELRARAWDFFIFYFHNFSKAGQATLIQAFQNVLAQSVLFSAAANQPPPMETNVNVKTRSPVETESDPHSPPAPRPLNKTLSALRSLEKQTSRGRKWPPPTPGRDSANGDEGVNIPDTLPGSPIIDARAKLRRSNSRSQAAS